jgi:hypothetical protein
MRTIVIGDLHGDWRGLLAILRATGAIDAHERRLPGTRVIQLGDLIHGGGPRRAPRAGVDDWSCAAAGLRLCDTVLIGHHELPLLWPEAGFPPWEGQRPLGFPVRDALLDAYARGALVPATSVGDWLLTHAGLHPAHGGQAALDGPGAAALLRERFARRIARPLMRRYVACFDDVGVARGGRADVGGIFWCDWRELTAAGVASPIPQIVGHTPQGDAPRRHGNLWGVDVGAALSGRACALVSDDDGATWEPVVVESEG